ncbi:MAG: hypothetical protein C4339_04730 [Nitrososphaerota archaeon]
MEAPCFLSSGLMPLASSPSFAASSSAARSPSFPSSGPLKVRRASSSNLSVTTGASPPLLL